MSTIEYLLTHVTPYIALTVFVGGLIYKGYRWTQAKPVPAHLSLYPRPESKLGRLGDTLLDMFTLRGLLKVNTVLWIGAFIMHIGLLLLLVGHFRVFSDYYFLWRWLRWGEAETHTFSVIAGISAGTLFMLPLIYLLLRRWAGPVKLLSTPEDYFVLVLLLGIARHVGLRAVGTRVAPRVRAPVGPSRGLFPLGFAGQPRPGPLAVNPGLLPCHTDNRLIVARVAALIVGRAQTARLAAVAIRL